MNKLIPLTEKEAKSTNGGWVGIVVALMAMPYQYGKDATERERRLNGQN